jgi:hypothetical membrane protein
LGDGFSSSQPDAGPFDVRLLNGNQVQAGVSLFVGAAFLIAALMLGEAVAPNYTIHTNPISDLGIIPETADLFNLSLFIVGVTTILGGYHLFRSHLKRWIMAIFAVARLDAVDVGIFTLNHDIHGLSALISLIAFSAAALALATQLHGPMRVISIALGLIGLIALVLHASGDFGFADLNGPIGPGGWSA